LTVAPVERQVFTVAELTRNVRFLLEDMFPGVWVEGEIGGFKRHSSGHSYFCVKDAEAQLSCVMFRREGQALAFEPEEGLKVLVYGRLSVYSQRGQYQLYVERMEPQGLGALQLRFQQLKEKLEKEGLFDAARKREIPALPQTIGIVTSADGAALRDVLNVLGRRMPCQHVVILPTAVQGSGAAVQIAAAIDEANELGLADVLLVTRGGGSLEDLWAFNEEIVARAIHRSEIPVVSAVGHEIDFTIADFVADLRAATPSAAAELLVPVRDELLGRIEELKGRGFQAALARVRILKREVDSLASSAVMRDPLRYFEVQCQRLDEFRRQIASRFEAVVRWKRERALALAGRLEALGPLSTLKRGFAVALKLPEGRVVTDVRKLKAGDRVETRLAKGYFIGEVKETHPE